MIVRTNVIPWFARLVGVRATAVTLGPFIFVKKGVDNPRLIRHEMVHVAQWKELWYLGFAVLYVWDWARGLLQGYDLKKAYKAIRFEQEARASHSDEEYLEHRKKFAWKKYRV